MPGFFCVLLAMTLRSDKIVICSFWLCLVGAAAIYWPGLSGSYILDDANNLEGFKVLDLGIITWRDAIFGNESGPLGRPVAMATFLANHWGGTGSVWYYKYTNLMIHLLCGSLIFWLTGRLLWRHVPDEHRWYTALFVAALWLFAPMHVSSVLYIVQRMAQLAALFSFAGLLCYVIGRQNLADRPKMGVPLMFGGLLVFLPLAAFSKENGLLLPGLCFLVLPTFPSCPG